jgi:hypothetical protein
MIVVRIEMHSARTGEVSELGYMTISNTGRKVHKWDKRHDYDVEIMRKGSRDRVVRRSLVRDYPRLAYTVWELVRRGLECSLGKWPIHPGHPQEFDEEVREPTFQEAWRAFQDAGYQYGEEALEQVRFGWEIAQGKVP